MIMMPFVQHKSDPPLFGIGNGKVWLWVEMGIVLLIKTVAAVGGLTSALLLVSCTLKHSVIMLLIYHRLQIAHPIIQCLAP
jgi:hypothetical protein